MSRSSPPLVERLGCALGVAFVLAFVCIAVSRLFYRFELTWLESAMYQMTERSMRGQPIYVTPSLSYTPCLYPPLYFDLAACVARLLGYAPSDVSFVPMRAVSILASIALFSVTTFVVRSKGCTLERSVALGSIVLASYGRFEGWQDSSRVDSLYSLLVFVGAALLLEGRHAFSALLSGVAFGTAILTKQPALVLMLLTALQLVITTKQRDRVAWLVASSTVTVVGYLILTHELGDPMLYHYVFAVPASHPLQARLFVRGLFFLPVTVPFLCVWVAPVLFGHRERSSHRWSVMLGLWFVATVFFRAKQGASINFFLPLIPVLIVSAAESSRGAGPVQSGLGRYFPYFPVTQLVALIYDPRPLLPKAADARTAAALVDQLRRVDGPVWFPAFPSYAALAGKPWYSQQVALADVAGTDPGLVDTSLTQALEHGTFAGFVFSPGDPLAGRASLRNYRPEALPLITSPFLRALHRDHVGLTLLVGPPSSGRNGVEDEN